MPLPLTTCDLKRLWKTGGKVVEYHWKSGGIPVEFWTLPDGTEVQSIAVEALAM